MKLKGRVELAITQDLDKAMARKPWAVAFIHLKCGIWCFEFRSDRDAVEPSGTHAPPRRSRNPKRKETP